MGGQKKDTSRSYAIQHRTTKMLLAILPSIHYDCQAPAMAPALTKLHVKHPIDAVLYRNKHTAATELDGLGEFAGAYKVKSVQSPTLAERLDHEEAQGTPQGALRDPPAPAPAGIVQRGDFDE